jgi:hypothetical protein
MEYVHIEALLMTLARRGGAIHMRDDAVEGGEVERDMGGDALNGGARRA